MKPKLENELYEENNFLDNKFICGMGFRPFRPYPQNNSNIICGLTICNFSLERTPHENKIYCDIHYDRALLRSYRRHGNQSADNKECRDINGTLRGIV